MFFWGGNFVIFLGGEISCFSGGEIFYFLGGKITSLQITLHCNVPYFIFSGGGILDSGGGETSPPEMPR